MPMGFVEVATSVRFFTANLRTTVPDAHDSCADFVLRFLDIGDTIGSFLQSLLGSPFNAPWILLLKTVRANATRRERIS